MKLHVTLTQEQLEEAVIAGAQRRLSAIATKRHTYTETNPLQWEANILSTVAEMAVCVAYGFTFSGFIPGGKGDRRIRDAQDAGPYEVRTVMKRGNPLRAKPKDLDHQVLIYTRVLDRDVMLDGWLTAGQVRRHGFKAGPTDWGIEPSYLESMADLNYQPITTASVRWVIGRAA